MEVDVTRGTSEQAKEKAVTKALPSASSEGTVGALAQPERHFVVIDGLRGIAAVMVLYYHLFLYVHPALPSVVMEILTNHAYLAVDAFFVISGYVIAHAFDQRVASGMSLSHFMLHRVVRLYPMIAVGLGLGGLTLVGLWLQHKDIALWHFALAALGNAVLLPTTALADIKPYLFPVNSAYWSLSFEMVMYLAYFLSFKFLRGPWLGLVLALSAVGLVWVAISQGNLNVGFTTLNYWDAFPRVIYSFAAGMLIRRAAFLPRLRPNIAYISIPALMLVVMNPIPASGVYDAIAVVLVMPLIVWLAVQPANNAKIDLPLKVSGEISYPLYAIHFPLVLIVSRITPMLAAKPLLQVGLALTFSLALVTVALLLNRFYDLPVRRFLSRVFSLKKRPQIGG